MGKFYNNGSMTMKYHILKVYEGLGGHAEDGKCAFNLVTEKSVEIY